MLYAPLEDNMKEPGTIRFETNANISDIISDLYPKTEHKETENNYEHGLKLDKSNLEIQENYGILPDVVLRPNSRALQSWYLGYPR